jgi:hypothetical protein
MDVFILDAIYAEAYWNHWVYIQMYRYAFVDTGDVVKLGYLVWFQTYKKD